MVGDVAGSGIPAAPAMRQLRSATRAFALESDPVGTPGEVLTRLSRQQLARGDEQLFTVIYSIVDPRAKSLRWANAGHVPPLRRTRAGVSRYLPGAAAPTGIEDVVYQTFDTTLHPQDTLILYTDGLVERRGESPDAGLDRLARAAASGPSEPAALCEHILGVMLPPGDPPRDDVTALVVKLS